MNQSITEVFRALNRKLLEDLRTTHQEDLFGYPPSIKDGIPVPGKGPDLESIRKLIELTHRH